MKIVNLPKARATHMFNVFLIDPIKIFAVGRRNARSSTGQR